MKMIGVMMFFLMATLAYGQERILVQGVVATATNTNLEGVTVQNKNSNAGTILDWQGQFEIAVAIGDSLIFRSVQFEKFTFVVDQGIVDSQTINIELFEAANRLEEVVIRPYDLSGNARVDVGEIKVDVENWNIESWGDLSIENKDPLANSWNPAYSYKLINRAGGEKNLLPGANPLAIIGLVGDWLFPSNPEPPPPLPVDMYELYNDFELLFYTDILGVSEMKIYDFLYFCEEQGLSGNLQAREKRLDLMQFLIEKAPLYLERQN